MKELVLIFEDMNPEKIRVLLKAEIDRVEKEMQKLQLDEEPTKENFAKFDELTKEHIELVELRDKFFPDPQFAEQEKRLKEERKRGKIY